MKLTQHSISLFFLLVSLALTSAQQTPSIPPTSSPLLYYPAINAYLFDSSSGSHPLSCSLCTMLVNAIETYTAQHKLHMDKFILNQYCSLFGESLYDTCRSAIKTTGPQLLAAMKKSTNPDQICREMKFCANPQCQLYPETKRPKVTFSPPPQTSCRISYDSLYLSSSTNPAEASPTPAAPAAVLNGEPNWRGKSCNATDSSFYPGRKYDSYPDSGLDQNCNRVSGIDSKSGKTYEELFCRNTKPLGIVAAGDSNTANFIIPDKLVDASQWHNTPFEGLLELVQNAFNVPEASGLAGFCPEGSPKPCRSFYNYIYQRNKCNYGDYQNIGVNGATVKNTLGYLDKLRRNQNLDYPLLVFLELTINDVCAPVMTTPEEFRTNLLQILDRLDTMLPAGSHLTAIGLIEDDIYERMKDKIHPSGVTNQDFYRFATCTGILPCQTLLNPDKTKREARLQRANELNQVYRLVFSEYKAKNFDLAYYDVPKEYVLKKLAEQKLDSSEIYDKMDGFHLSQNYDVLLADYLWETLMKDHPEWLGEVNPNNKRIEKMFIRKNIGY